MMCDVLGMPNLILYSEWDLNPSVEAARPSRRPPLSVLSTFKYEGFIPMTYGCASNVDFVTGLWTRSGPLVLLGLINAWSTLVENPEADAVHWGHNHDTIRDISYLSAQSWSLRRSYSVPYGSVWPIIAEDVCKPREPCDDACYCDL